MGLDIDKQFHLPPPGDEGTKAALASELLNSQEDNISLIDGRGTIVAVNTSWHAFANANQASLSCMMGVGLNYLAVCDAAQGDVADMELAQSCATGIRDILAGTRDRFEVEYPCHSPKEQRWFRLRVNPRLNGRGAVIIHEDITALWTTKRALRDLEQSRIGLPIELDAIVDSLPALIGYWDKSLRNRFANQAYRAWSGTPPEEILGKHMRVILGEALYAANLPYIEGVLRGEQQVFERDIRDPSGKIRSSHCTYVPHVVQGEVVGFSALISDVTQMKHTERSLREAKAVAEKAVRAKGQFLANISHEFRTPMNGVLGMADLALRTPLSAEQHEYVQGIRDSATTLLVLLNDLLDFERIEAGRLEIARVPFLFRELIESTVSALAPSADGKGLELTVQIAHDVPDAQQGDPTRIRQLLTNILSNAIKFTTAGEVSLHVTAEPIEGKDDAKRIQMSVRDTGIGIPREQQERIFEPFSQADESVTRRFGGTGLGLSICARLAGLMGGKVWVESELGNGSTFHVTVDIQVDASQHATPRRRTRLAGMPILGVDAHATRRTNLSALLAGWGLRPTVTSDIAAATAEIRNAGQPFPLAILTARAPEPDGLVMVAELRRASGFRGGVVLLVSSVNVASVGDRGQALGVHSVLSKHVREAKLVATLEHAFDGRTFAPAGPGQQTPVREPRRVLLAEDDLISQLVIAKLLEKRGHRVVVVGTGMEAVERLAGEQFDVLLTDLQMPQLGGIEATRLIRAREAAAGAHIRIAAMTAMAQQSDEALCREAGMDGFLTKPLNPAELYAFVEA